MSYKEYEPGTKIYDMFDHVKNYYVILSGAVTVEEKNPKVKDWDWVMKIFKGLQIWKRQIFDRRVLTEIQMKKLKNKLITDTK